VFVASGLAVRRAELLGIAAVAALVFWGVAVNIDVVTSPELQRDDWRAVARLAGAGEVVVVYPYYQGDALTRQRPSLVEQAEPVSVDKIVVVLAGASEPPASFRPPGGFRLTRTDKVQHFVVREYTSDDPALIAPRELSGGQSQTDADLRILVAR
jgi:hypothetical protein